MRTNGTVGAVPSWYSLIRAAKYLHVAPWDLAQRPYFWTQLALEAAAAEQAAARAKNAAAKKRGPVDRE